MISNEAVEAALNAFYVGSVPVHPHDAAFMRRALEAAAPCMLAEAWEAGREVGLTQDFEATTQITNPYRSQA